MLKETFKHIKFGWKEVLLCAVFALLIVIFVIVFTGNTANVRFVSPGGHFDASEDATVYDYQFYTEGDIAVSLNKYHQILSKTYRISAVASLPKTEREGYQFEGWYLATVNGDGSITYTDTEFTSVSVKSLAKDSLTTVYAKWSPIDDSTEASIKDNTIASLDIAWKGMLGIFIVATVIYLCVLGLNYVTKKTKKKDQQE
jgi:uncharacterized repeat protein (TIGR02543 family)